MELIPSFSVDHTRILPGIYVSRVDKIDCGDEIRSIVTYDIRMKIPNKEPAIHTAAMHSIEHLVATYLRNNSDIKDSLIYWGPMGCMTGCYMITNHNIPCDEIREILIGAMEFVVNFDGSEVPGTDITQCGNYKMHDLEMAKYECRKYLDILKHDCHFNYPMTQRKVTENGDQFYDS